MVRPANQLWRDAQSIAESDGTTISPGYWETVYRTNVQTAYNAGRRMQFDRSPPAALALMVLEDERTSDICRPLAGLVLPYNHPFWDDHWPPFHFNCRTTVRGIYEDEVGRIPSENVPMHKLRKEFKPQSGFGQNPIKSGTFYELTDEMAKRALRYGIMGDIYKFAKNAGFVGTRLYNPESLDGFELIQSYPSGGKIYKHESFGNKLLLEEPIARQLAKGGRLVKLLPRSDKLKSPDLMIDGEIWELKTPTAGTKNSIFNAMRTKQSENIILNIQNDVLKTAREAIHERINQSKSIKKVWIITQSSQEVIQR